MFLLSVVHLIVIIIPDYRHRHQLCLLGRIHSVYTHEHCSGVHVVVLTHMPPTIRHVRLCYITIIITQIHKFVVSRRVCVFRNACFRVVLLWFTGLQFIYFGTRVVDAVLFVMPFVISFIGNMFIPLLCCYDLFYPVHAKRPIFPCPRGAWSRAPIVAQLYFGKSSNHTSR